VEILRQTWVRQYQVVENKVKLRDAKNLPPSGQRLDTPYDPEARFGNKRSSKWTGYKVHWTETCEEDNVHLITHVVTTKGNETDFGQTEFIHQALKSKELLPSEHMVDTAYVSAALMLETRDQYQLELVGPMRPNCSWQEKMPEAYDISRFKINWKTEKVICPQGHQSRGWTPGKDSAGKPIFHIKFSIKDCRPCPNRDLCTRCKNAPRHLVIRNEAAHEALQALRIEQKTEEWKKRYNKRAGIEGTLAKGIQVMGLRRTRYIGLAKTHLQHVLTATAMNMSRIVAWLNDEPLPKLRVSRFGALAPV
jgi:transposase